VTEAEDQLARLGVQVEALQSVLVRLLQDVVRAEARLEHADADALVEANQKLVVAALISQADAEAARQALQDTRPAAMLDALTKLPNRPTLADRFAQAIAHARRHGSRLAVLFVDLDDFKPLNDRHGHPFGDEVLQLVAQRMLSVVREVDTVSRYGGDEFLVLLLDVGQAADVRAVAEKLLTAIGAPTVHDERSIQVSASIGIALFPDDGEDAETLVARADAAMYRSKRQRRGGIAFHGAGADGAAARPQTPPPDVDDGDANPRQALLREANERLVLAAIDAQELRAAAERAQRRQAAFLAAVASELDNPLAPIRIATAMLGRVASDDPLLPRVRALLDEQVEHVSRLVGHLVDRPEVEAPGVALEHLALDLGAVIDAAVAAHRPVMLARDQAFESHRPPGPLPVVGDALRLEQVVANLLDNASKHTLDGGRISLSVVASADHLTLTVSDNGIGIRPQLLPYLFNPFVQDTQALGLHGVGLGIGLTVVRALVEAHGGRLQAHSAGAGRGSQFVVTLPWAGATAPPPADPAPIG